MQLLLVACLAAGWTQDVVPPTAPDGIELVRNLAPGEVRAIALIEALPEFAAGNLKDGLVLAHEEFVNQARAFRMDLALPLAEAMHARAKADWSAASFAIALTRAGRSLEAHSVLSAQLEQSVPGPARYMLLEGLGLSSLAAGNETLARRELGGAFAQGSSNAGVVLGDLALRRGRTNVAKAVFRSLLDEELGRSWAHRGWGLSMLPLAAQGLEPQ